MHRYSRPIAIVLAVVIGVVCWVSLKQIEPPPVVPASQGEDKFSAERALSFLHVIAKEPHPSGSRANNVVRDYILNYCKEKGLETELMDQTGISVRPNSISGGRTQNILARLKGSQPGKAILVIAHYDSQPNTPGASDDGIGVAAMMETIRLIQSQDSLANDVFFLFTDQEETGLLGAESFVSQYKGLDEIGLIINLEARGNAGVSFTFEFSKLNGWMMRNYKKAVERPYANSFAYEIYKLMPNDTDFSRFRSTNISGFNSALINGYSYYHSMIDRVEYIDIRSLQHQGDLLTQSLAHFGNVSLENTKDEDMIFFSPFGSYMLLYPLSWDIPLMIVAAVLWVVVVSLGTNKRRIKISAIFGGMGLFTLFLILSMSLVFGLSKLILLVYPHYTNFYSNNFYNATDYFWAVGGVTLLCFVLLFKYAASKDSLVSVMLGSVFILLLLMVGIKMYLNTGTYLIYYPTIILLVVYAVLFNWNVIRKDSPLVYGGAQIIVLAPALALWLPVAYTVYVVFSLEMPLGAVLLLAFCAPSLLPSLGFMNSLGKFVAWIFPVVLIATGLIIGHLHSFYNNRYPLQTELMYAVDADSGTAFWISTQQEMDPWLKNYFPGTAKDDFEEFYPGAGNIFWKSNAEVQQVSMGKIEMLQDSVSGGKRILTLRIIPDSISRGVRIYFFDKVTPIALNDRLIETSELNDLKFLQFYAPTPGGIILRLEAIPAEPLDIRVIEQRPGLPSSLLRAPLPGNFIYRPDYLSNTTQVKYEVKI